MLRRSRLVRAVPSSAPSAGGSGGVSGAKDYAAERRYLGMGKSARSRRAVAEAQKNNASEGMAPAMAYHLLAQNLYRRYTTINVSKRACAVQFKRDWHQVAYLFERASYQRNGFLTPENEASLEEKFFERRETTWHNMREKSRVAHQQVLREIEDTLRAVKEGRLEEYQGFRLAVRESALPEQDRAYRSGDGLFVDGEKAVPAGSLVTMVPGMWYVGQFEKQNRGWVTDSEGTLCICSPHIHQRRQWLDTSVLDSDLVRYNEFKRGNASKEELKKATTAFFQAMTSYRGQKSAPESYPWIMKQIINVVVPTLKHIGLRYTPQRDMWPVKDVQAWAYKNSFWHLMGKRWDHNFARGNAANHTGWGRESNAMYVNVTVPVSFPRDLLPYLPYATQPSREYGRPGVTRQMANRYTDLNEEPEVRRNHIAWGRHYTTYEERDSTQFLMMTPATVLMATRDIAPGEEILVNMRKNPHPRFVSNNPLFYTMTMEGQSEDWLANNMFHPRTTFFKRLVGIFDPDVSWKHAWHNPEIMDTDIMYCILRKLRIVK